MRRMPPVDPVSPKTTSNWGMAIAMDQTMVHQIKDSLTRLQRTRSPLKRSLSIVATRQWDWRKEQPEHMQVWRYLDTNIPSVENLSGGSLQWSYQKRSKQTCPRHSRDNKRRWLHLLRSGTSYVPLSRTWILWDTWAHYAVWEPLYGSITQLKRWLLKL